MPNDALYTVTCFHCKRPFDAVTASECDCLQRPRSLTCPHCQKCFCSAPQRYKTDFWANAPRELWSRRKATPEPLLPAAAELARPLVLFADDDSIGRAIAQRVVAAMGLGVVVAANGDEALSLAREHKPDLLITDAFMPKLDGREVARLVKEELPQTKVVVISGLYKDPRYKHEALKHFKVDDYLTKPVDPTRLRSVIEKTLGLAAG